MRAERTGILTKLVLLALVLYAMVTLIALRAKVNEVQKQMSTLEDEVANQTAENDDIQFTIEHSEDDDVIRDVIRDELGLVEPGEEVFTAGVG